MIDGLPQASAKNFGDRIREWALVGAGLLGDRRDAFVRVSDLEGAGIATVHARFLRGGGGNPLGGIGDGVAAPYEIDLTPPPTPTGLLVTAGISKLVIQCDSPAYTQGHGHDRTIVYGATYSGTGPLPTFSSAVEITQFLGAVADYATNPSTEWHIWIKWKSRDGVLSAAPAGGTNGFTVTTGQDVSLLLNALTAAAENPAAPYTKYAVRAGLFYVASDTGPTDTPLFAVVTTPITVNGVVVPVGVYMASAFIMNGTITNAKIGNAAIDTAKIADASISTAKIGDAQITTAKIADASISTAKIQTAAITTALIADANITTAKIGTAQITTANIADANITGVKIADAAITNAKILDANISTAKIAGAAIVTAHIADANITTAKIADLAVDTVKIAGAAVTAPAFSSSGVSDLTMTYTFTGEPGVPYTVFILGSLVQTNFSTITLQVNGTTIWTEAPIAATVLCKGWVVSLAPGTHSIRLFSSNAGNTNGTAIFALATKR